MDGRINKIIEIIREHFAERLSEQTLSRDVNLSPGRLRQLFKRETGLSPMQYVRHLRMEHAATLLRTSFLSTKEIAFQSGANDLSHFVRAFKKRYGETPGQFRGRKRSSPLGSTASNPG